MERNGSQCTMSNDIFLKENSMNNDNKSYNQRKTEYIATKLVRTFEAPQSYNFFLKCAWNLSEAFIWNAVEASQSKKVKSPIKYFVSCCHREMSSR